MTAAVEVYDAWSRKKILGIPISALLEMTLFLGILLGIDFFFLDRTRYIDFHPNPFWIIVLLITVQYGTSAGIVCVILCTLSLYLWNIPPQKAQESLFDYQFKLALLPLLWFISAFVLGELRMRDIVDLEKQVEINRTAKKELTAITDAYDDLRRIKESIESQLGSQLKTSNTIYETFKSLGTLNPGMILLNLDKIVQPILNPKKFSVYSFGPSGFESTLCVGWSETEKYQRRFTPSDPLYKEIAGKQRQVCIANQDDEKILAGEGILAAPMIDHESGEIFGMLKIEEIDYYELNFSNLELFNIICDLVGMAYANARQYRKLEANTIYHFDTELYTFNFYKIQKHFLVDFCTQEKLPLAQASLIEADKENFSQMDFEILKVILKDCLPSSAQVFQGKRKKVELLVLLPHLTNEEANTLFFNILNKIQSNGTLSKKNITYKTENLCPTVPQ
ncbi:MAG: hypothetical protein WC222_01790 [Parachlamydiales bacterium]|jgi:hypothetical protein